MSKFLTYCFLFFSMSAMAQETIVANNTKLYPRTQEFILVRNSQSPKKMEIIFQVAMDHQVCVQQGVRYVFKTSGPDCGYDYYERQVPVGQPICVSQDHTGRCRQWRQEHRIERTQTPRSCQVQEVYCMRYGTETRMKGDDMTLKFVNLPALGGSEIETFRVSARQKSYDSGSVKFEVEPLQTLRPYKVKKKKTILGIGNDDDLEVMER